MSSNGIFVDHAALDLGAERLRQAVAAIDDRLHQLTADLSPLVNDWEGSAQSAYLVAKARWDATMTELRGVLAQAQTAVAQSNAEYAAADLRGARAFGG